MAADIQAEGTFQSFAPGHPAASSSATPAQSDSGGAHFLRFLGYFIAVGFAIEVIVGLFWFASMLQSTGRRKRDWLMLLIPVWGTIVFIQTLWRHTSRTAYWSRRVDM